MNTSQITPISLEEYRRRVKVPIALGYWYLLTPYSRFPGGLEAAYAAASRAAAILHAREVTVFSPIVYGHALTSQGLISGTDYAAWQSFDEALMAGSRGGIVAQLPGWADSEGIKREREFLALLGKPVHEWPPNDGSAKELVRRLR